MGLRTNPILDFSVSPMVVWESGDSQAASGHSGLPIVFGIGHGIDFRPVLGSSGSGCLCRLWLGHLVD